MLRRVVLSLLFALAGTAAAQAQMAAPLPPQPASLAWPTRAWARAQLPRDVDRAAFDLAITEAMAGRHPQMGETRAVLIVQGGRIVFERYGEGYGADTRMVSWSMAKSITQALVGAAVEEGRLSIDDPMGNTAWREDDRRAAITWRQWLQMVDGVAYREIGATGPASNDAARMLYGVGRRDTGRFAAGLPLIHDPGAHWNYSSAGYAAISAALTRVIVPDAADAAERRTRMRDWMQQRLFGPTGMNPVVEFDPQGVFYGSSLIYATARDFARFGYLYLRGGVWDGVRVLPEGWVDFARLPGPADNTDTYGAGWWLTPLQGTGRPYRALITDNNMADVFSAQGHEGQIIVVAPRKDLVLVRLGLFADAPDKWDGLGDWAMHVIAAFGDRPIG